MKENNLPDIEPTKGEWAEEALNRRGFLHLSFWMMTATAGLMMSGSSARFLLNQSLSRRNEHWVEVGKLAELPPGVMNRVAYRFQTRDVWRTVEQGGLLYAYTQDDMVYSVLEATCTHLGCNVKWDESDGKFKCPCHGGVFARDGIVLDGPPAAPLRQLQTKIENGVLYALI